MTFRPRSRCGEGPCGGWFILFSPAPGWPIAFPPLHGCGDSASQRGGCRAVAQAFSPGPGAVVLVPSLWVAGSIPRGAARSGVYACQIYTQRGSWSHLRRRLLLRPGTRAYAPPTRRGWPALDRVVQRGVVGCSPERLCARVREGGGWWMGYGRPPKPEGFLSACPVRLLRVNKKFSFILVIVLFS